MTIPNGLSFKSCVSRSICGKPFGWFCFHGNILQLASLYNDELFGNVVQSGKSCTESVHVIVYVLLAVNQRLSMSVSLCIHRVHKM